MNPDQIFSALRDIAQAMNSVALVFGDGTAQFVTTSGGDYPENATPLVGAAAGTSNASLVATLAASAGGLNYITGFDITASGSTAPDTRVVTVANVTGSSLSFIFGFTTGNPAISTPMSIRFPKAIPANTENLAITVTMPLMPVGVDNAAIAVYGYRI